MAASDSATVGRQMLELHPDLAEEIRNARTARPGLAYISDLTDTATEVFQTPGGLKASETPNLQLVTSVGQTGERSGAVMVAVVNLERFRKLLEELDQRTPGSEPAALLDSTGHWLGNIVSPRGGFLTYI